MSNITKNLNIYKDVTSLIGMRSWGKEDLVVPYKQLNGTKVGSPTVDENCVVTNFSNSRYIYTTPFTFNDTTDTFKVDTYVKLSSLPSYTFIFTASSTSRGAATQSSTWKTNSSNGNQTGGNLYANRWYHLVLEQTGDSSVLYVDGQAVINAGKCFNSGDYINFGKSYWEPFYNGFIDFSQTSIQINGEEVWRGTKGLSQISRNDMQNYVLSGIEMQPVINDNKAVIDFSNVKLPWKFEHSDKLLTSRFAIAPYGTTVTQPKYEKKFNATKIGSPTVSEDFVASGFDTNKYFTYTLQEALGNDYEVLLKFHTSDTTQSGGQVILSLADGRVPVQEMQNIYIALNNAGTMVYAKTGDGSTNTLGGTAGLSPLQNNTDYYIKLVSTPSSTTFYASTTGFTNMTMVDTVNASLSLTNKLLKFGYDADNTQKSYLKGSIDFKECSIKKNGVEVWRGVQWVDRILNGTKIGSPIVTEDFVASGFGSGSYIRLPNPLHPSSSPWEIVLKVKTPASAPTRRNLLFGSIDGFFYSIGGELNASRKFGYGVTSNGSSWNIGWVSGTTEVDLNTWYYIRMRFTGTEYTLEISKDGIEWSLEGSVQSTTPIYQTGSRLMQLGTQASNGDYYTGSIDLNECYIKINGEEVWRGVEDFGTETLSGCIRYYYGEGEHVTTPPRDSTGYYNIYAVNGDEGVVLDSTYFHEGTMVYNRPIVTGGEIPQFENEWYLGNYELEF